MKPPASLARGKLQGGGWAHPPWVQPCLPWGSGAHWAGGGEAAVCDNRGQSCGLGACAPSALAQGSISCWWFLLVTTSGRLVGLAAAHPTSSPSPRFHLTLFTAWCTTASWQTRLCQSPGLQGAGWTPRPLPTWTDGMAGAQWDCDLGLSEGALERQFTNSCHPVETSARGISKTPSLSKAEASHSWVPKAIQDAGAFLNPSKSRAEGQQSPEHAPWAQWLAGVFKGGSSHTQWGEEPGLILDLSSPYPQLLCATNNKCFRETAQTWTFELGTGSGKCLSHPAKESGTCSPSSCGSQSLELLCCSTAPTPHLGLHPPAAQAKSEQGTSPVAGKVVFPRASKAAFFYPGCLFPFEHQGWHLLPQDRMGFC